MGVLVVVGVVAALVVYVYCILCANVRQQFLGHPTRPLSLFWPATVY